MPRVEIKKARCEGNRDRLSDLPDSVLHNIMSFLGAQQAVQSCVLSKRWKTLWTTLHILNFKYEEFLGNKQTHRTSVSKDIWDKCQEFVSTILLLREPTCHLHTVSITCSTFLYMGRFDVTIRPWIRYIVKHNPRVIIIDITVCTTFCLYPKELFTCPSLEQITLNKCDHAPDIVNLPLLKRLHLRNSNLGQDFVGKLFRGCPQLEDLHVEGGLFQFSEIISMSLKHLTIKNYHHLKSQFELINAPNLLSLHLTICAYHHKKEVHLNLPSLCEASIIFDDCSLKKIDMTKSLILYGLFNVQSLQLKGCFTESIQYWLRTETPKCPTFSKLVSLSVSGLCLSCRFGLLSSFLERCPNLRRLALILDFCHCDQKQDKNRKQINTERFQCKHLESIEVQFFGSDEASDRVYKSLQEAVTGIHNVCIKMSDKIFCFD